MAKMDARTLVQINQVRRIRTEVEVRQTKRFDIFFLRFSTLWVHVRGASRGKPFWLEARMKVPASNLLVLIAVCCRCCSWIAAARLLRFEKLIERRRDAFDRKTENSLHTVPMEMLGMALCLPVSSDGELMCTGTKRFGAYHRWRELERRSGVQEDVSCLSMFLVSNLTKTREVLQGSMCSPFEATQRTLFSRWPCLLTLFRRSRF